LGRSRLALPAGDGERSDRVGRRLDAEQQPALRVRLAGRSLQHRLRVEADHDLPQVGVQTDAHGFHVRLLERPEPEQRRLALLRRQAFQRRRLRAGEPGA
jgi:hypothetical protein